MALTIVPKHPGTQFATGAIGLSVETSQLATQNLNADHRSLVTLMRQLGPAILRLGGDSLDYSWWTGDNEAPPSWARSVVTPADLMSLRTLLTATGWRVVLGVDLGHYEPARAANEASVAEQILGSRLVGIEIGNEPDAYATSQVHLRPQSYGANNYLEELAAYRVAIDTAVPNMGLYGPDLASPAWLTAIASGGGASLAAITQHYYPTAYNIPSGVCKNITSVPTALDLLSAGVREQEDAVLQALVGAGQVAHREVRISETNTTSSCDMSGGPDTSPVFASALWALDWILRSASAGVAGINFHGNVGICTPDTFSPICAPNRAAALDGQVAARPEYYGLLAARKLEGGYFVPVDTGGPHPLENLAAYATVHDGRVITLAIDDFGTEGATPVTLTVPGYRRATQERLSAPSLNAISGVTFGHVAWNGGKVQKPKVTNLIKVRGNFRLRLSAPGADVVTLYR